MKILEKIREKQSICLCCTQTRQKVIVVIAVIFIASVVLHFAVRYFICVVVKHKHINGKSRELNGSFLYN